MSDSAHRMDLLARTLNHLRSMKHEMEVAELPGMVDILDNAIYFTGRAYQSACEEYSREAVTR